MMTSKTARTVISVPSEYRLRKMANLCAHCRKVLDVGWACQPNIHLQNREVIGLDLQNREASRPYTASIVGDAMELPAPFGAESFDGIVAGEVIEHVDSPMAFLKALWETLTPGGLLVLSTPNPHYPVEQILTITLSRRYFYTMEHVCLYPQRWLIRMMERAGFQDIRLYSGGIAVPFVGYLPFPRPWCYETIAVGVKPAAQQGR